MARILLVDDDQTVLSLERLILSEAGHEVLMAESARAELDLLRLYQVDLLIVDIMMPELNGFQFVNLIKNNPNLQKFPIAFLTSKSDRTNVMRAGELGANLYIMKPIDRDDFTTKIEEHFKKHPPRVHPKVAFHKLCAGEAKVVHSVNILSLSDLNVEVLTDTPLELDQAVELSAAVFHEIPIKRPLLRVISVRPEKDGRHKAMLSFLNIDTETVRQIQRWVAHKRLKP